MLSEHLLIPSRNLPYGMIITRISKRLKVDLFGEKAIAPSVDINSTLLKRMQTGTRVHALSLLSSPNTICFWVYLIFSRSIRCCYDSDTGFIS